MLVRQISSQSVYFVAPWLREGPNFAIFLTLVFRGVANWWHRNKVGCGCKTTNLPLSDNIKILSIFECLDGKIVHTNYVIHKQNKQKNATFFAAPIAGKVQANQARRAKIGDSALTCLCGLVG